MSGLMFSLKKPVKSNAGAVTAKKADIVLVDTTDILTLPSRDSKGVRMIGNIVLKPGANMIELYLTPSTQTPSYESEGEEDSESFIHQIEGMHPGNKLEAKEFFQNNIGRGFIAIWSGCNNATGKELYGSPCAPLKMQGSFVADNERTGFTFTFASVQRTSYVPATYEGALTLAAPYEPADFNLNLTAANGAFYKLPTSAAADAIDIATTDLEHGDIVTLIGGGGASPATLSNGAATAGTVQLVGGADWVALSDATIDLQVFDDGTTLFFREVARR